MSGSRNGVASQICSEEKRALYVHCHAHALNVAVGNCIKNSKVCREALETAFQICKLIKFSPKRNAAFEAEIVIDESPVSGIRTLDGPSMGTQSKVSYRSSGISRGGLEGLARAPFLPIFLVKAYDL